MISLLPLVEVDPVQRLRTDRLFLTYLARIRPGLRRRANYPGETVHFADEVSRSSYRFQQGQSAQRLLIGEHGGQARGWGRRASCWQRRPQIAFAVCWSDAAWSSSRCDIARFL